MIRYSTNLGYLIILISDRFQKLVHSNKKVCIFNHTYVHESLLDDFLNDSKVNDCSCQQINNIFQVHWIDGE